MKQLLDSVVLSDGCDSQYKEDMQFRFGEGRMLRIVQMYRYIVYALVYTFIYVLHFQQLAN